MSNLSFCLMGLLLAAVIIWQLVSGKAFGTWWLPRVTRQVSPALSWFVLALQVIIMVPSLTTAKNWKVR